VEPAIYLSVTERDTVLAALAAATARADTAQAEAERLRVDGDRRVEAMREAVLREARAAVIAERDAAERPDGLWIAGTAAGVHAIDKLIEALPATPAPETEQRCLGCGMYGGAHRDCPAPRLVDVHEWDRIRGADTTPAPGPSAEDALRWPKADDDDAAKGWTYDPSWLARVADAVDRVPDGEDRPSLEVVENVLRALAHLATGEGQANG